MSSGLIYKSTFNFKNSNILEAPITEYVSARLEKVGPAIARLYFVQDNAEVAIPKGLEVLDETHGGIRVDPYCGKQSYALCWSDSYSVRLNGEIVIGLTSQRLWTVVGDRETPVYEMET